MDKLIVFRNSYFERIKPFIDKNIIKVLTGQRRVGKSYLLLQLKEEIERINNNSNIIYIDKEDFEFNFIKNSEDLYSYVEANISSTNKNYLMIDEIQDIFEFEKVLRHYQSKNNIDIYCTGSNAKMLSSELSTYLSGRYIEFKVYSLSYNEFLEFNDLESNKASLDRYLRYGGLPFLRNLPYNNNVINEYLKGIYTTIIYKDVVGRNNIRNTDFLENLVHFLASDVGNIISGQKIRDYLKSQDIKTSTQNVLNYLSYLENAFLIYKVFRKDIIGKKIFEINNKYYFEDWGLSNAIIGEEYFDIGKTIENVIYINLLIAGYDVNIGQTADKEIDFVAEKEGSKIYIQASYLIPSEKVKQREFGNLLLVKDNYPKYVVSLDEYAIKNHEGVKHLHLLEFLEKINEL
jgi:predicted AAA+ superfamily ATPase